MALAVNAPTLFFESFVVHNRIDACSDDVCEDFIGGFEEANGSQLVGIREVALLRDGVEGTGTPLID